MTINPQPLIKSLTTLKDHLSSLKKYTPNPQDHRVNAVLNQLSEETKILKEQIQIQDVYPYEFYEETGRVVSMVSAFRIDLPWEAFFQKQQIWPVLNTLVNQLAEVVYQQECVQLQAPFSGSPIDWDSVSILELDEWVAPLEEAAKMARKEADESMGEAEQLLVFLHDQMNKPQNTDQLMESSIELTKGLYVKNAVAAIATDRAIAARQYFINKAGAL